MDTVAERLCKVIKYAGYGLFVYFNYEFFYLEPKFSSQIFSSFVQFFLAYTACIVVPFLIKWILLGNVVFNDD